MADAIYMFSAPASGLLTAAIVAATVRQQFGAVAGAALGFASGAGVWATVGMLLMSSLR